MSIYGVEGLTPIEEGVIIEDSYIGAKTFKVYIKKLTPFIKSSEAKLSVYDGEGILDSNKVIGYKVDGMQVKMQDYLIAKNATDYVTKLETGEDGDLTLEEGTMEAKGELAINQFQAETMPGNGTGSGSGTGANGGGPIATVVTTTVTIPPIPLNPTASSPSTTLEGDLAIISGKATLTDLNNKEIPKGTTCVVMFVGSVENCIVTHITGMIEGRTKK